VRQITSTREFDRLLEKHASQTGLPVVVDFYSDGCGPCRMMAPVFKNLAKEVGQDKAVFVKVDTNTMVELSQRYQIRSLPTFMFFLGGKKWNQFSGAGEGQLRQMTEQVVRQAELDNVILDLEDLKSYYKQVDPSKTDADVQGIHQKCADMMKKGNDQKQCLGSAATQLSRRLKKKYKQGPNLKERFTAEDRQPGAPKKEETPKSPTASSTQQVNLHLASKEQLQDELEKRLDAERELQVEQEEDDDDDVNAHSWTPSEFPERVVIVGGGPAGLSAALYTARAGLAPLVIAPPMGGQLQGKGVDVENYPGLPDMTGPGVVAAMRNQAAAFGAVFEDDIVISVNASTRPLQVHTENVTIPTHTLIVATGAESKWLGVPGEYDMRGGGVSSCATCDGSLFRNKHVVVVGGGDTAMEDALVLARTSSRVTVIHRRDTFRASKVLAQRVMDHAIIDIMWNTVVEEIVGKEIEQESEDGDVDLDSQIKVVSGVKIRNVEIGEKSLFACDAVFVAIGHTPATKFVQGVVEEDPNHPGYLRTEGRSTRTSVPGIFAAGDVTDAVYRQAITSAGSGAAAALDAERYLSEEGLGNEAAELEAELLAEIMDSGSGSEPDLGYNAYADAGGRVQGMKESLAGEL